jgi:hypothetical protein
MNLHSSDELRQMADRCRGMANHSAAIYPAVWLQLSDKWDAMAEETETLAKTRSPTDPDLEAAFAFIDGFALQAALRFRTANKATRTQAASNAMLGR